MSHNIDIAHLAVLARLSVEDDARADAERQLENIIDMIGRRINRPIDYRVLVTMYDDSNTAARVIHTKMRRKYQGRIFDTIIEQDIRMPESQILNVPVLQHDKQSESGLQYFALAREIQGQMQPKPIN